MVGVLIVSHGRLAEALISSVQSITGNLQKIMGVSIWPTERKEEVKERIRRKVSEVDDGDGVVILTDILGGTPTNLSLSFLKDEKVDYPMIIDVLESIKRETGIEIKGFSDLTEEELTSLCGLSLKEAEFAKKREYDEPFIIEGGEREVEIVKRKIEEKGMNYVWGGKFHHIVGKNDKGKAIGILKELYGNQFFSIFTVAIGDSLNDLPMLLSVDHPVFLKGREDHSLKIPLKIQNLIMVEGDGPQVWNDVILSLVNRLKI